MSRSSARAHASWRGSRSVSADDLARAARHPRPLPRPARARAARRARTIEPRSHRRCNERGKLAERAGELDRLGKPEAVGGHAERPARQRRLRDIEALDRPGPRYGRAASIRIAAAVPESRSRSAVASPSCSTRATSSGTTPCSRASPPRPDAVVASVGIADADHDQRCTRAAAPSPLSAPIHVGDRGNASRRRCRVVVADRLLAAMAQRLVGQVQPAVDEGRRDPPRCRLVLRGRRHDLRFQRSCRRASRR